MATCHRRLCLVIARPGIRAALASPSPVRRPFSSLHRPDHRQDVLVQCASSSHITVSLYNLSRHSEQTPLLIYLPPFSRPAHLSPPLPRFTSRYPTAVINYRWLASTAPDDVNDDQSPPSGPQDGGPEDDYQADPAPADQASMVDASIAAVPTPLHWPTPLHDLLSGYSWVKKNLAPRFNRRRDVYVYGSYLGATLAASLALTESLKHERVTVRGAALHNGVYDWSTFLPDHPVNRLLRQGDPNGNRGPAEDLTSSEEAEQLARHRDEEQRTSAFDHLERLLPPLFNKPDSLFDPFASPCYFFHSPPLFVPPTFDKPYKFNNLHPQPIPPELEQAVPGSVDPAAPSPFYNGYCHRSDGTDSEDDDRLARNLKIPSLGFLTFPPRQSGLRIPEVLLMHEPPTDGDAAPAPAHGKAARDARRRRRLLAGMDRSGFASQAGRLAALMRRSVDKLELRDRRRWDENFAGWETEAARRVRLHDLGATAGLDDEAVDEAMGQWLKERIGF